MEGKCHERASQKVGADYIEHTRFDLQGLAGLFVGDLTIDILLYLLQ